MKSQKFKPYKNTDIISASEIGQYHYCSMAWYLQKCGYEPKSIFLESGVKKHRELGQIIDQTQRNYKKLKIYSILGYLTLIIAVIIFIFEVI